MSQLPASASYTGVKPYRPAGAGRTLFANSQNQQMLDGFWALAEEDSSQGYHAKAVKKAVNELRGCTAPVNSYMKDGNPNRRCVAFSGFEIEYELGNYYSGPQTDVTIVDIRCTKQDARAERKPALWDIGFNENSQEWKSAIHPTPVIKSTKSVSGTSKDPIKVGINGYAADLAHAARMLPIHILKGNKKLITDFKNKGYYLLYTPQSKSISKAGWSFLRDLGKVSESDMQSARILSHQIIQAHKKQLHVEWTSHRGGSKVLTEAMRLVKNSSVNLEQRQRIFLSDHTSSQYDADILRRAIGMDTSDEKWHNATPGIAQLIGGKDIGTADVACSINELLNHTPADERMDKLIDAAEKGFKTGKSAYTFGVTIAGLATKFGITRGVAATVIHVIASSIPKYNEDYHSGNLSPYKAMLKRGK
ncbi:hypothetical protein [Microbulbifer celer]|uniref:Uncharacterized protein n=1 Tax=Microbulbifer celer TaxID=435905 RepID=A0ABW3U7X7_9GAMM|nr:hypothetical protein [Microbulbifer celer]UFN56646.1 hypothetical protein LPW13_13875 [Microbulbifer celer]